LFIIVFVQNDHELYLYAFLNLLATFLTVFFNIILLRREGIRFSFKRRLNLRYLSKSLLFVFGITFIITAYNQTDSLLLGYFDTSFAASGAYSVGVRGIEIVITIITSLSGIFVIRTTRAIKDNDMPAFHKVISYSTNITFFIGVPAVMFMIGLAPEIVRFIVQDSPYWTDAAISNATIAIMLLASLMLTYSIHDGIYQQILVPLQKERTYFFVMLGILLFNISFSVLFALFVFPTTPLFAVALITLISEVLTLIVLITLTRKYVVSHLFNINNIKIIVAATISLALVLILKQFGPQFAALTTVGLAVIIGGAIYIGVLLLLKENLVRGLLKGDANGS
jgi:O-antigen/teichoic acid export membrane protein